MVKNKKTNMHLLNALRSLNKTHPVYNQKGKKIRMLSLILVISLFGILGAALLSGAKALSRLYG